ncbi:hypothetical protein D0T53_09755 [Dysgonomonas sp. 216]|uniref:hypothetical protein n=1 Tax=Dysgonomonas sp. 216 TaxID=2302934 RepID=UPI0013D13545|nr:hypothetical protein [Dysgonomonas sp. 216]NDW19196.1 hypothetical protein [Dysgonomonas sp. 216]
MKATVKVMFIVLASLFIVACGEKNKEAKLYLEDIKSLYENEEYELAKQKIDSIQKLYPKAFDEIKASLALLQDVRKAQNIKQIAYCDSVVNVLQSRIDSIKQLFTYDINKEYQESGRFLPKTMPSKILSATTLRAGVKENGQLFIESVFVGNNKYHEAVKVSLKDGSYTETLPVNEDGLNFRFTDAGKNYEVITFTGKDENGIARFIYTFADKPLNVTLTGKSTTSFALSGTAKKAISDTYLLSDWMLCVDSLKSVKEKAELLIKYIDEKKNASALAKPVTE